MKIQLKIFLGLKGYKVDMLKNINFKTQEKLTS